MASAAASLIDAETFSASSERDALDRVLRAISPAGSEVLYTYDEGGGLQKVDLEHRDNSTAETVVQSAEDFHKSSRRVDQWALHLGHGRDGAAHDGQPVGWKEPVPLRRKWAPVDARRRSIRRRSRVVGWQQGKIVLADYVGVHAGTGLRTKVVNVYRTKAGHVHAAPGTPLQTTSGNHDNGHHSQV